MRKKITSLVFIVLSVILMLSLSGCALRIEKKSDNSNKTENNTVDENNTNTNTNTKKKNNAKNEIKNLINDENSTLNTLNSSNTLNTLIPSNQSGLLQNNANSLSVGNLNTAGGYSYAKSEEWPIAGIPAFTGDISVTYSEIPDKGNTYLITATSTYENYRNWIIQIQNAGYTYMYPNLFDKVVPAAESSLSNNSTAWSTGKVINGSYISATYNNGEIMISITDYDPLASN